jgi:saccharopine dehydrogenase (NAD+, L-lysine forming)
VIGINDGRPRETFAYQMADAEEIWRTTGLQVVGWQTGFNPTVAMELLASGVWSGAGVLGPEAFDPDPYLALMDDRRFHHATVDMHPGEHQPT